MRTRPFAILMIVLLIFNGGCLGMVQVDAADVIDSSDFREESWSRSLDIFDYVREHAEEHGKRPPPEDWSSDLHLNYINLYGVQMLYAGFVGVTLDKFSLTVPLQTFIEHFETSEGQDAVTASTFLMMLAYNETDGSLFPNSPDQNDRLYASFSLGCDLMEYFGGEAPPRLSSSVEVTPLIHSDDKLEWSWGMRYPNMTTIWWSLNIADEEPGYNPIPIAFSVYDELAFNYRLVFDPEKGTAKMYASYVVGEMRDLWLLKWVFLLPQLIHYNATGCYLGRRQMLSTEAIHDFLHENKISISLVLFQKSVAIDHLTYSESEGVNVTDSSIDVSDSSISTFTEEGEKIFEVEFGIKRTYTLFNSTQGTSSEFDSLTRTCEIESYSRNPIFYIQTSLLRFLPLVVAKMDPSLYLEHIEGLLNITGVDYLYITSYPTFEGYRITHDPIYTSYFTPQEGPEEPSIGRTRILMGALLAAFGVIIVFLILRRK